MRRRSTTFETPTTQGGAAARRFARMRCWATVGVVVLVGVVSLATTVALTGTAQATWATAKKSTMYYVSLGDSYSVGYQPGRGATAGYTGYVANKTKLTLVNFGCAGATATSIIHTVGCPVTLPNTAGAVPYPRSTQATAADAFLKAHRGHIGLVTVSIGGNDVTGCATQSDLIPCVERAVLGVTLNVVRLARALRAAAGPNVPLIGLTYPDVVLGTYVYPSQPPTATRLSLAQDSVLGFKYLLNPALSKAYGVGHGVLVDVTAATGAYTPLTTTTTLAPYGTVPVAVAKICTLTWSCKEGNIHATTAGYTLVGQLIVARYATMHKA
jgi:lysophospholipase L1-like esterase